MNTWSDIAGAVCLIVALMGGFRIVQIVMTKLAENIDFDDDQK